MGDQVETEVLPGYAGAGEQQGERPAFAGLYGVACNVDGGWVDHHAGRPGSLDLNIAHLKGGVIGVANGQLVGCLPILAINRIGHQVKAVRLEWTGTASRQDRRA